jgi:hypothetical protein
MVSRLIGSRGEESEDREDESVDGKKESEPTLVAGLSKRIDLKLVSRLEPGSGAVALRHEPNRNQPQ